MKIKFIAIALATVYVSAANAQSMWDGPYVGASVATFSGENTYNDTDFDLEGNMFGAFAGYNMAANGYVWGGEISIMAGQANEEEFEDEYEYTSLVDLRGRIGYDAGNFMPYALLGASFGRLSVDDDSQPNREFDETATGVLFGIGAEYAVNDQFIIGAEIVSRSFEFEFPDDSNLADMEATVNSFSLRGAYKF